MPDPSDRSTASSTAADAALATLAQNAGAASASLAAAADDQISAALTDMASRLRTSRDAVAEANARDLDDARADGMTDALLDRLRIDGARLEALANQLDALAALPAPPRETDVRPLPGGLRLVERRRPIGVVGVNYEARPLVTIDVASQLLKSRNAGVLRTGSAALGSARALRDQVIAPALATAGIETAALALVDDPGHEYAYALVRQPVLVPLVILRGSGETTAALGAEAARHGVRTLAHAEGGGVLYADAAADPDTLVRLLVEGTDRLGVCNRINLLLVASDRYDEWRPVIADTLAERGIRLSEPPHAHPLGHEWALDPGAEATVTIAPATSARDAARIANEETSGLAATVVTEDEAVAEEFLDAYAGTGAFHNATTRILDGARMLGVPETGINIDKVPGPRGPVTFADLHLRQWVVRPAGPPHPPDHR